MRITNSTVNRRYLSNLERSFTVKNRAENRITSNRKFERASEAPINAAKALRVRKSMANYETHEKNLETAKSIYQTAESSVMGVSSLIQSTYEQLIYGANGTQSETEDEIISESIRQYADEMVQLLNVSIADRNLFGGTANDGVAWEIRDDVVFYNGKDISSYQNPKSFPNSLDSFTDIGIGMSLGNDGRIDEQSALKVTFNGAEIMGCGYQGKLTTIDFNEMYAGGEYCVDVTLGSVTKTISFYGSATDEGIVENMNLALQESFGVGQVVVNSSGVITNGDLSQGAVTVANTPLLDEEDDNFVDYDQLPIVETPTGFSANIIQLTIDAANCLKSGDKEGAAKFADALYAIQTNLSLSIADIGNTEEFIDFNLERITNGKYSLAELQNELEYADLPSEITNWKVSESIYNAALQMSASVIPMTIFSFMS